MWYHMTLGTQVRGLLGLWGSRWEVKLWEMDMVHEIHCLLLSSIRTACLGSCGATIPGVFKRSVNVTFRDVQWWT